MAEPRKLRDAPPALTSAERRHARLGLILFIIYSLFYAGFVYLAAFRRAWMAKEFLPGINLAVLYGIKLIFGAIALALIYALFCRTKSNSRDGGKTEP